MKLNMEQQRLVEGKIMEYAVIRGIACLGKTSVSVARIPYFLKSFIWREIRYFL